MGVYLTHIAFLLPIRTHPSSPLGQARPLARGFRVDSLELRVEGLGLRGVEGLGLKVKSLKHAIANVEPHIYGIRV